MSLSKMIYRFEYGVFMANMLYPSVFLQLRERRLRQLFYHSSGQQSLCDICLYGLYVCHVT